MGNVFLSILLILGGVFSIYCSVKDMDWFFNHRKARPLVKIFGRPAVRIFYIILGAMIVVFGLLALFFGE